MGAKAVALRKITCVTEKEAIYVESVLKKAMIEAQQLLGKAAGAMIEIENDGTIRVLVSRERIGTRKAVTRREKEPRGGADGRDRQDQNSRANRWGDDLLQLIEETVRKLSPGRHVVNDLDPDIRQRLDGRLEDLVDSAQGLKAML